MVSFTSFLPYFLFSVEMTAVLWQCCLLVHTCLKLQIHHMCLNLYEWISTLKEKFVLDELTIFNRQLFRLWHIHSDLKHEEWLRISICESSGGLLTSCSVRWYALLIYLYWMLLLVVIFIRGYLSSRILHI